MQKTPLPVGQNLGQKDLVGGKKSQRVYIACKEGIFPAIVYPGPGVVVVEDHNPVEMLVSRCRGNPQIYLGIFLLVNGPGGLPIDLFPQIPATKIR